MCTFRLQILTNVRKMKQMIATPMQFVRTSKASMSADAFKDIRAAGDVVKVKRKC